MSRSVLPLCAFAALLTVAGCQCGGADVNTGKDSGNGGGGDGAAGGGGGTAGGAGGGSDIDAGGGTIGSACSSVAPCSEGSCFSGVCCDSAANSCNGVCCQNGTACLFGTCVSPGAECRTSNDCGQNAYCEPLFGGDAGTPIVDAGTCSEPLPSSGRCVSLPPTCDADGGGAPGCVEACEYRPDAGRLDAIVKWHWEGSQFPAASDVWSTPTVARVFDANCDGKVDELDPPQIIFVSGDTQNTCCQCAGVTPSLCKRGVLRVLNGRTGKELWSLDKAESTSSGFAALSVAIGDVDNDGELEIVAATGEGKIAVIGPTGQVEALSTAIVPGSGSNSFGWGGGIALGDMDGDGKTEITFASSVFTLDDAGVTLRFNGTLGKAGGAQEGLSTLVDLNGDGKLELLAGRTAYELDGGTLWNKTDAGDGFPGVGDFNKDGVPEVVLVQNGQVSLLSSVTGDTLMTLPLSGTGVGGPPTVADFDGDGLPEIGIAQQNYYFVVKPDFAQNKLSILWQTPNHDFSSSVTGSTVFDFEGDGPAEVIYGDECFLWVFDGKTGAVRFSALTSSFTGTEASIVADVDGDGRAEIVMVSNEVDTSPTGSWKCQTAPWNQPDPSIGRPAWQPRDGGTGYRGITVFGDRTNSWVGTRTLWNQHTYHVSNICDSDDNACTPNPGYGKIPRQETANWSLGWLNNFRQNALQKGLFNAPDPAVSLTMDCTTPIVAHISVRNEGIASLPAGAAVALSVKVGTAWSRIWAGATTRTLSPGQVEVLDAVLLSGQGSATDIYKASMIADPGVPNYHECRSDNDESAETSATCIQ